MLSIVFLRIFLQQMMNNGNFLLSFPNYFFFIISFKFNENIIETSYVWNNWYICLRYREILRCRDYSEIWQFRTVFCVFHASPLQPVIWRANSSWQNINFNYIQVVPERSVQNSATNPRGENWSICLILPYTKDTGRRS